MLSYLEANDMAHRNLNLNAIFIVENYYKLGEFNEAINIIGQSSSGWHELKSQEKSYYENK